MTEWDSSIDASSINPSTDSDRMKEIVEEWERQSKSKNEWRQNGRQTDILKADSHTDRQPHTPTDSHKKDSQPYKDRARQTDRQMRACLCLIYECTRSSDCLPSDTVKHPAHLLSLPLSLSFCVSLCMLLHAATVCLHYSFSQSIWHSNCHLIFHKDSHFSPFYNSCSLSSFIPSNLRTCFFPFFPSFFLLFFFFPSSILPSFQSSFHPFFYPFFLPPIFPSIYSSFQPFFLPPNLPSTLSSFHLFSFHLSLLLLVLPSTYSSFLSLTFSHTYLSHIRAHTVSQAHTLNPISFPACSPPLFPSCCLPYPPPFRRRVLP